MQNNVQLVETKVYAGRLKDRNALMQSSSGGAFTAVSDLFLDKGYAVACSTYNYEKHIEEYRLITTKKQRDEARGSKYMQSKAGGIYRECFQWLRENPEKSLLFVGMGCQADGFRKYSETVGVRDRVFIVDIVCHGSPSPRLWRDYIKSLEKKQNGKCTFLTFKDKRNGWNHPTAFAKINGEEIILKEYMRIFYDKCNLRPACYECPYATTQRKTDMTIGDFWHIEKTIPDFYDPDGNSLFLIHTNKGEQLFEDIKKSIDYKKTGTAECRQDNLEHPTPISPKRKQFWHDYSQKGIDYVIKKYGTVSFAARLKKKAKRILLGK